MRCIVVSDWMIRRIIAALGVAGAEVVANVIEIAIVIEIAMIPILLLLLLMCVAVVAVGVADVVVHLAHEQD